MFPRISHKSQFKRFLLAMRLKCLVWKQFQNGRTTNSSSMNTSSPASKISIIQSHSKSSQPQSIMTLSRGPQLEPIPAWHLCTSQNTAARLAVHHFTIGATSCALQRPTEAQLRWAQFHSQSRARKTRAKVDKLMQTPKHVKDVFGATKDDCNSSDSNDSSNTSLSNQ